jgi:hypothetical protein
VSSTTTEPEPTTTETPRPRRGRLRRYGIGTAVGAAALIAGILWHGGNGVPVTAPSVSGAAAHQCAALNAALPATVLGHARRTTVPKAPYPAAWGNPAIVLRCGVGVPAVLAPGSTTYDPTVEGMDMNGVCWVNTQTGSGGYVFTTVKQQAYVEVTVPNAYQTGESPLPQLTAAIEKTDPIAPDQVFDCS